MRFFSRYRRSIAQIRHESQPCIKRYEKFFQNQVDENIVDTQLMGRNAKAIHSCFQGDKLSDSE